MDCFATIPSRLIIFLIAIGSLGVLPLCFDRPIYRLYTGADILAANNGFAANGCFVAPGEIRLLRSQMESPLKSEPQQLTRRHFGLPEDREFLT